MRHLLAIALLVMSVACGARPIETLQLQWRGVDGAPRPSPYVAQALSSTPVAFGLRDVRPDPTAVGLQEDGNQMIRTTDSVAQFSSAKMGEMLRAAGARLDEAPMAVIETDLVEYKVDEGGKYNAVVAIRVTVRRSGNPDWSKTFQGTSSRWGKSHSPDNFNEALSNALHEATEHLITDDSFGAAVTGAPPPPVFGGQVNVDVRVNAPPPPPPGPPAPGQ